MDVKLKNTVLKNAVLKNLDHKQLKMLVLSDHVTKLVDALKEMDVDATETLINEITTIWVMDEDRLQEQIDNFFNTLGATEASTVDTSNDDGNNDPNKPTKKSSKKKAKTKVKTKSQDKSEQQIKQEASESNKPAEPVNKVSTDNIQPQQQFVDLDALMGIKQPAQNKTTTPQQTISSQSQAIQQQQSPQNSIPAQTNANNSNTSKRTYSIEELNAILSGKMDMDGNSIDTNASTSTESSSSNVDGATDINFNKSSSGIYFPDELYDQSVPKQAKKDREVLRQILMNDDYVHDINTPPLKAEFFYSSYDVAQILLKEVPIPPEVEILMEDKELRTKQYWRRPVDYFEASALQNEKLRILYDRYKRFDYMNAHERRLAQSRGYY